MQNKILKAKYIRERIKKVKYYIDFDYTLFDTYKFRNELYKILELNGLDKSYLALTLEMKSKGQTLLNVRKLFKELSKSKQLPQENLIFPLEELYSRCEEFLYSDSIEFLKFLKANRNEVYLLTWGDVEFQQEKVSSCQIDKLFDGIIYTEELKYTLDNVDYENGIFIDDSIRDLEGLYNRNAKKVIRIKRQNGKNSEKTLNIKEIEEFTSLKELQTNLEKAN